MKTKIIILLINLLLSLTLFGYEKSDAFLVKIFDDHVKVLAPPKYKKRTNLILENKTMLKIYGKIVGNNNRVLNYITIEKNSSRSVELKSKINEKVFFVPVSPPFQKVELLFGSRPYEIPSKK